MQRQKLTRVITFRVSEEEWFGIQRAAEECGITLNEWCRTMALERLNLRCGLSKNQVVLFGQIARTQFLVESALQLLAEDNLEGNVWKSYRTYARGNLETILDQALAECSSRPGLNPPGTDAIKTVGSWQIGTILKHLGRLDDRGLFPKGKAGE